ncbi:zinc ribbon-containing protein [Thermococcus thermotolerans]|uniref:zinc ribbon-containing protein n=1 Tax=Thermococcus thermotolerans TaxID=2969672 RepID=UPI0021586146|nr:zinc ribbon-containing protein [Thermococcus thermotolerans]
MGEIVVKIPDEIERYLTPALRKRIELETIKEIEGRIQKASRFIKLADKSELTEEEAENLAEDLKRDLAKRYGVI